MKTIKEIEYAEISSYQNLFFEHKINVVCLHDDLKGELGWFKVWYDAEMQDSEYIVLNDEILYLDTINEL
jgi:hypothetical protein